MTEETRRLIPTLVWNDRNFMDIFTANYGYVNSDLAALYGVPAPAGEFDRVAFPATPSALAFGAGSFLALTAKPERDLAHRPRPLRARTVSLPACARSAAGRQHEPAAGDRSKAHDQTASAWPSTPPTRAAPVATI